MKTRRVKKRGGEVVLFDLNKIIIAVGKAMHEVSNGKKIDNENIAKSVEKKILKEEKTSKEEFIPTVEHIQDLVEEALMESDFHDVAKAYILYRNKRAEQRRKDIFKKRIEIKPVEYPELKEYITDKPERVNFKNKYKLTIPILLSFEPTYYLEKI
jgi:ribonucleoside-diphosphate reductase beta chain